jgi:hypothetical protein
MQNLMAFASSGRREQEVYHAHEHGASAVCFCRIRDCATSPPVT